MSRRRALRILALSSCLLGVVFGIVAAHSRADTGVATGLSAQQAAAQQQSTGLTAGPVSVYVAESEYEFRDREIYGLNYNGFAAFIDDSSDTLVERTAAGYGLSMVAVSPDGSRVYMTDEGQPVLHVFDAETRKEIDKIELPGVTPSKSAVCSSGVACTPDGSLVLVGSSAGLQVIDTASDQVVRTLSDLRPDSNGWGFKMAVAVSFDGKRAYVTTTSGSGTGQGTGVVTPTVPTSLGPAGGQGSGAGTGEASGGMVVKGMAIARQEYRLVCLDLQTWKTAKEIPVDSTWAIAVKPDDSEVFLSEQYSKGLPRVRVVDALTLEDLWSVDFMDVMMGTLTSPESASGTPRGLALTPDGTKLYVVTFSNAITPAAVPTCYCSVVDTEQRKVAKEIRLDVMVGTADGPQTIAVQADGKKAYINGGLGQHAIVIDTVKDEVLGVIGDESLTNSGGGGQVSGQIPEVVVVTLRSVGIAVRPFWWSTDSLVALGLATAPDQSGSETSQGETPTSGHGGEGGNGNGSAGEASEGAGSVTHDTGDGGLSGGWIALIVVLVAVAAGLLGAAGYLFGRVRRAGKAGTGASAAGTASSAGAGGAQDEGSAGGRTATATEAATTTGTDATTGTAATTAAAAGGSASSESSAAGQTAAVLAEAPSSRAGQPPAFCSTCGACLDAGGRFCPGCGRQI
jgi:DNA-binding beta-propeller fold protein YncE